MKNKSFIFGLIIALSFFLATTVSAAPRTLESNFELSESEEPTKCDTGKCGEGDEDGEKCGDGEEGEEAKCGTGKCE